MPKPPSVLIATPREIVNAGLKRVLEGHATVIGETTSDAKAVAMAKKLAPTVALVSDQFPGLDAVDTAVQILTASQARVVMIGVHENPIYMARAATESPKSRLPALAAMGRPTRAGTGLKRATGPRPPSILTTAIEAARGQLVAGTRPTGDIFRSYLLHHARHAHVHLPADRPPQGTHPGWPTRNADQVPRDDRRGGYARGQYAVARQEAQA
jgi:CheY-like chemotaxis protein